MNIDFGKISSQRRELWQYIMPITVHRGRFLSFFIPSFLNKNPGKSAKKNYQHGGISSLDGLRGFACLFVVNEHVMYNFNMTFLYGLSIEGKYYFVQWPFVRIMWCGLSMVNIFFIISGYVLTYKPFLQIHGGDPSAARATIASSTFRRVPRLYLPMWTSVVICGVMTWLGFYNQAIKVWNTEENNLYNLHEGTPIHFGSLWLQLRDVIKVCWHTLDIFAMKDHLIHAEHYDKHTWTIPVEFRCSMILFTVISAISHFKMRFRISLMILMIVIVMLLQQRNTMSFFAGAILSDFDRYVHKILQRSEEDPRHSTTSPFQRIVVSYLHPNSKVYPTVFVIGLYFLCVPTFFYHQDPLYSTLVNMVPLQSLIEPDIWLRFYGAIMVVWAVANSNKLKPVFVNPVPTYLGKISFALYLVHGNVIRGLCYAAIPTIYSITGDGTQKNQTPTQMFFSTIFGLALVWPISLYLSDLFMKGVDVPLTKLGRRVELAFVEDHHNREPKALPK